MVCVVYLLLEYGLACFSLRVVTQALFEKVTKFAACQCIAHKVLFIGDVSVSQMKRFKKEFEKLHKKQFCKTSALYKFT